MNGAVTVLDYGVGNLASVINMLRRVGVAGRLAQTADALEGATAIILPGVGAFDYCVERFEASGLKPALLKHIECPQVQLLGICVGFQMLFSRSAEGVRAGLGLLSGEVVRFDAARLNPRQKIPHMGWADVEVRHAHPLFAGIEAPRFYFVHSYHAEGVPEADISATAQYGYGFACAVARGNIMGVQFHPEKSHRYGMRLLKNFAQGAGL